MCHPLICQEWRSVRHREKSNLLGVVHLRPLSKHIFPLWSLSCLVSTGLLCPLIMSPNPLFTPSFMSPDPVNCIVHWGDGVPKMEAVPPPAKLSLPVL